MFCSCYFPQPPHPATFHDVVEQEGAYIIQVDGKPVSRAWSERQNERCAEAAVVTLPDFQRRGYARQVTTAWAYHIIGQGRVALYSYKADNHRSEALACSLGVVKCADVMVF